MKVHRAVVARGGQALSLALACVWGLTGCADVEHVAWTLASSTKPAILLLAGQTLEGDVQLRPDRTGIVQLRGSGTITSCAGSLRFTAVNSGLMDMRCSDGAVFDLRFSLLNEVKGYAYGTHQDATVALTFGMDALQAQAYLAPAQQRKPPVTTDAMPVAPLAPLAPVAPAKEM